MGEREYKCPYLHEPCIKGECALWIEVTDYKGTTFEGCAEVLTAKFIARALKELHDMIEAINIHGRIHR
jgi:hypothetical protein